jgi:hypothetical protein
LGFFKLGVVVAPAVTTLFLEITLKLKKIALTFKFILTSTFSKQQLFKGSVKKA